MSKPGPSNTTSIDPNTSLPEVPWAFIECSTDTLIILISHMLNLLIQHNDQVVLTPDALTRFHSRAAPGISVIEYLRRIVKYTNMEKIPLLSLLAYIDITCQHLPTFTLSSLTVHRFLIAGVCAGSKAQCDVFCTNAHYAKVGGIKTQELNGLEREFLKVTEWNLCCNADLLQRYYTSLIRSHGGYTQAAAPQESPFVSFPHSVSKPPSPAQSESGAEEGEGDDEMVAQGGSSWPDSEYGSAEEEIKRPNLDVTDISVNQQAAVPSSSTSRRRPKHRPPDHVDTSAMELDPPDHSPFSIATSSSIPSSSRSSLRGARPPTRGRTASLSFSDPKLAEPKVDHTTASGEGAPWSASAEREDNQEHAHDHHGGRMLRNLVGGIFRRKSHADPTVQPPVEDGTKHHIIPSRPIHRNQPHTQDPPPVPATASPPPPPHPIARSPPIRSSQPIQSPGIAKPVTPRVRTREERSVEPLNGNRLPLGPAGAPAVMTGDREERRARLE